MVRIKSLEFVKSAAKLLNKILYNAIEINI